MIDIVVQKQNHYGQSPKKKILLVEDDVAVEPIWRLIAKHLTGSPELDWVTSEAAAERAIMKMKASGRFYDVIICDIFLSGGKTGIDLWRKFRTEPSEFVFTSGISVEKFEWLMARENVHYPLLTKPLNPEKCISTLNSLLQSDHNLNIDAEI